MPDVSIDLKVALSATIEDIYANVDQYQDKTNRRIAQHFVVCFLSRCRKAASKKNLLLTELDCHKKIEDIISYLHNLAGVVHDNHPKRGNIMATHAIMYLGECRQRIA